MNQIISKIGVWFDFQKEKISPGYGLHKWIRKHKDVGVENLVIEMSSLCNLQCKYCNFHGDENLIGKNNRGSLLSWELAELIGEQSKDIKNLKTLTSYHSGEEFLNPEWFELLNHILTIRGGIPSVIISTNGMLLNEENSEKICHLNADHIQLNISFSGNTIEETEKNRKGLNYSRVRDNIYRAHKIMGDRVSILITVDNMLPREKVEKVAMGKERMEIPDYIKNDFSEFNVICGPTFLFNPEFKYIFEEGVEPVKVKNHISTCKNIYNILCVDSSGYVLNCCCNGGYERLGNIKEKHMLEIWRESEVMQEARKKLFTTGNSPEFCKNCPYQNGEGSYYILTRD